MPNIAILGDGGVGKTALVKALRDIPFEKRYLPTVGCEIHPMSSSITLWDFAGQERYGNLNEQRLKKLDMILLMYDVTSRISYKNLASWYDMIHSIRKDIPVIIVGNKVDCEERYPIPTFNIPYYEISARTRFNVQVLLDKIGR
jgi:GTP-binding nuclear protein Ran